MLTYLAFLLFNNSLQIFSFFFPGKTLRTLHIKSIIKILEIKIEPEIETKIENGENCKRCEVQTNLQS